MIRFRDGPNTYTDEDSTWAIGRIVAGDLDEEVHADLHDWDKATYESQWLQALKGLQRGDPKAVLITRYVSEEESDNLEWWALYRDGDTVHVQNHLPRYESFDRKFSVTEPSSFLHDRRVIDQNGNTISEWDVSLREVEFFVGEVQRGRKL
jgi:CdiI N-terminal domain